MYDFTHVKGKNKGKIILYALSTCIWCKKVKYFLDSIKIEYDYVFIDLLDGDDRQQAREDIKKWNPRISFPTLIINDKDCIVGFKEDDIREALKID
jgi:glutaredoxin